MNDLADGEAGAMPLEGVKVVDFSQMIAGPAASLWLADYGARVIKVEPPQGDGGRALRSAEAAGIEPPPLFAAYNRDKVSIRLDLKDEADRVRAWDLIAEADVVMESSVPGVMDRLGLGPSEVRGRFPRLVYASVSGFGAGPIGRTRRGVDLIVQAESGMMSLTGYPGGPPTKVGFTIVDAACGHALCHGILAALFRRERTGVGATISVSLCDVALNLQAGPLAEYLQTGVQPPRAGNAAPHTAPADLFDCADGQVIVAAYLDDHWRRLLDLLGDDRLRADARFATPQLRVQHRADLYEALNVHFRTASRAEWIARLREARLLVASVNSLGDVLADPLTAESGVLINESDVFSVRTPVRFDDVAPLSHHPMAARPSVSFDDDALLRASVAESEVSSYTKTTSGTPAKETIGR